MKVKGISKIYKRHNNSFCIKFTGWKHYWLYDQNLNGNYRWEHSYHVRKVQHFTWESVGAFEFMLLTGTSLLSAIKYGKIASHGDYNNSPFRDIRRHIRKLNPVPRKKRTPKPKRLIWQLINK
jgi:hypothetical protein